MKHPYRILTAALFVLALTGSVRASDAAPRYLALTFDDGPTGAKTERLLDGLQARGVHATFFLCGYRIATCDEALLERYAAEGHELGVHGYSHNYLQRLSKSEVLREVDDAAQLLTERTGIMPVLFRPPGGLCSDAVLSAAAEDGLAVVLWSVDPQDWKTRNAACVTQKIIGSAQDGDIILMHDLYDTSVTAALQIVDMLQAQGFSFVTVSELAQLRGVTLTPGQTCRDFR